MGSISVSYRNACYRKIANVRVRGVPELEFCLVFRPDEPEVFTLNPSAWFLLELCDGRRESEIAAGYYAAVEPLLSREEVLREVREGLQRLKQQGIVETVEKGKRDPARRRTLV